MSGYSGEACRHCGDPLYLGEDGGICDDPRCLRDDREANGEDVAD